MHPGTLAYLNGEQAALLDETLNYYWLGAMVFAVVAPLAGWIASRRELRRGAAGTFASASADRSCAARKVWLRRRARRRRRGARHHDGVVARENPIAMGLVDSLPRPGQNATGFTDIHRFLINLKSAKAAGIDVPLSLLIRADELIA